MVVLMGQKIPILVKGQGHLPGMQNICYIHKICVFNVGVFITCSDSQF